MYIVRISEVVPFLIVHKGTSGTIFGLILTLSEFACLDRSSIW